MQGVIYFLQDIIIMIKLRVAGKSSGDNVRNHNLAEGSTIMKTARVIVVTIKAAKVINTKIYIYI